MTDRSSILEPPRPLYIDCEADSLLEDATTIWCIVAFDPISRTYITYVKDRDNLSDYLQSISKYTWIGHNLIAYDRPLIHKLANYEHPIDKCLDTFVLSCLFYPDRDGHSLEYYGTLLGLPKIDYNDFSKFSEEMLTYCTRDVDLLAKTYAYLKKEHGSWDWGNSILNEHRVAEMLIKQEIYGVLFNVPKAEVLLDVINNEVIEIESKALQEIPKRAVMVGEEVGKPFKKDGSLKKNVIDWYNGTE